MFDIEKNFRELNTDGVCSYLLEDEGSYYVTAYKAMKNDSSGIFLECNMVKHNGKPKFVYFTEDMYSIEEFVLKNSVRDIADAVYGLSKAITLISDNGFLSIVCVDTRLSRIFWDKKNRKVKLIYLPIKNAYDANMKRDCEIVLCKNLLEILHDKSGDPEIQRICQNLQMGLIGNVGGEAQKDKVNVSASMVETVEQIDYMTQKQIYNTEKCEDSDRLSVESITNFGTADEVYAVFKSIYDKEKILIDKKLYVIGKSKQKADGVLENPTVSRQHCQVECRNRGEVFITDLGSSNGTFINGERLLPNQTMRLMNNMRVKIANIEFMVDVL